MASIGTQQVIEVVLGDTAQEVALVSIFVEAQQHVQHLDSLIVVVIHHKMTPHIVEIILVVLRRGGEGRQQKNQHQKEFGYRVSNFHPI